MYLKTKEKLKPIILCVDLGKNTTCKWCGQRYCSCERRLKKIKEK